MLLQLDDHIFVDTDVKCQRCGVLIVRKKRYTLATAKFCSYDCGKVRKEQPVNIPNQYRNERYHARKEAVKIFGDKCIVCGWTGTKCDAAHIIAVKDGGVYTEDNVVMLCPNHHRMFDAGKLSVEVLERSRRLALINI